MGNRETIQKYWREIIITTLITTNMLVWIVVWQKSPSDLLRVYFLDVGQGDSILIETPSRKHLLIDGGANKKVLAELGKILPFGMKNIDVLIASHPDKDHIGGLPEVVSRYEIGIFLESGVESENSIDGELDQRLEDKNVPTILARRGMVVNLGEVRLTILFPNQDVSRWETNDASIVARLDYGESSFLLTGDSPVRAENILLSLDKEILDTDVLKAGHHGSRTSTSLTYAQAVSPEYTVISAGRDNSYGHPHKEVLDTLNKVSSKILNTSNRGTIKFETDGKELILK